MSKYQEWWDNLTPQMKEYLKSQPVWYDKDIYKAVGVGILIGFIVGFLVGFEVAWRPVVETFRPLVG